ESQYLLRSPFGLFCSIQTRAVSLLSTTPSLRSKSIASLRGTAMHTRVSNANPARAQARRPDGRASRTRSASSTTTQAPRRESKGGSRRHVRRAPHREEEGRYREERAAVAHLETGNEHVVRDHEHAHEQDTVELADVSPNQGQHCKHHEGPFVSRGVLQIPERRHPFQPLVAAGVVIRFGAGAEKETHRIENGEGSEEEKPDGHSQKALGKEPEWPEPSPGSEPVRGHGHDHHHRARILAAHRDTGQEPGEEVIAPAAQVVDPEGIPADAQ